MRDIIKLAYKSVWMLLFLSKSFLTTRIFRLKLWLNHVDYGKNVTSANSITRLLISKSATGVKIGNAVAFNNYDGPSWNCKCCLQVKEGGKIIIGDNSGFNGVYIYCSLAVTIGEWVKIGGGTMIIDTDFHPLDFENRRCGFKGMNSKPVVIEDDVFVGTHCIICKGVRIGSRSIVAAGSVVVKDIPNGEVWGGNPAKFIRKIANKYE